MAVFSYDDYDSMFYDEMKSSEGFIKLMRAMNFAGYKVNEVYKDRGDIVFNTIPKGFYYNNDIHEFVYDVPTESCGTKTYDELIDLKKDADFKAHILDVLNKLNIENLQLVEVN